MRDQDLLCAENCRPEVGISWVLQGLAGHDLYWAMG